MVEGIRINYYYLLKNDLLVWKYPTISRSIWCWSEVNPMRGWEDHFSGTLIELNIWRHCASFNYYFLGSFTCFICRIRPENHVFEPCGHQMCKHCAYDILFGEVAVRRCPFCRAFCQYIWLGFYKNWLFLKINIILY